MGVTTRSDMDLLDDKPALITPQYCMADIIKKQGLSCDVEEKRY
jgi:hypothetical protein